MSSSRNPSGAGLGESCRQPWRLDGWESGRSAPHVEHVPRRVTGRVSLLHPRNSFVEKRHRHLAYECDVRHGGFVAVIVMVMMMLRLVLQSWTLTVASARLAP